MARIDIDIEDFLDEVRTEDLITELSHRENCKSEFKRLGVDILDELSDEDVISDLEDRFTPLNLIRKILGLRPWHDKERIIKEINEL